MTPTDGIDDLSVEELRAKIRTAAMMYRKREAQIEQLRQARNALVRVALDAGMPQAQIARAAGLTRGRINQIKERD